MLNFHVVKNWNFKELTHTYTERDTMLYALGIGFGSNPRDEKELRFVFEDGLQIVPSMACVLGVPSPWWRDPRSEADWIKVLHGEQHFEIFQPLPGAATLSVNNRVVSLTDKGPGRGAVALMERNLYVQGSNALLARTKQLVFLRGDGGFSEISHQSDPAPAALAPVPSRPPDARVRFKTLRQAALIYRLSGDYNPLHADQRVSKAAGFQQPILHGLCTYGMAARAVLRLCCGYDGNRLRSMSVRFTSPVYPGETLGFEIWQGIDCQIHFRCLAEERGAVVLDNGLATLREPGLGT